MYNKLAPPLLLCILVALSCLSPLRAEGWDLDLNADSAILMDADTGAILYAKEPHKRQYPASITKIVTGLLAVARNGPFLDEVTEAEWDCIASISSKAKRESNFSYPPHWLETGATHMGIKKGEQLTLRDLLHGMMIVSANDAANVIAQYLGGSIPNFMDEANSYLAELGVKDSHFVNPNGLHHPNQYTTAYDMAIIAREALKYPLFRDIVAKSAWKRPKTNKQEPTTLAQGNRLVRRGKYYYPPAIGIKTGYTQDAQNTFVAAAQDGDRTLIAVLLRCPRRDHIFEDATALFEAAFSEEPVHKVLVHGGAQGYRLRLPKANRALKVYAEEELALTYYPAENPHFEGEIRWLEDLQLPISQGAEVGQVVLRERGGEREFQVPLYAVEEVHEAWIYRLLGDRLGTQVYEWRKPTLLAFTLSFALLLIRRRPRRR